MKRGAQRVPDAHRFCRSAAAGRGGGKKAVRSERDDGGLQALVVLRAGAFC